MERMPSRRALLDTIERLVAENERLRAEIDRLVGRIADLEAQLARAKGETHKPRPPSWVKPNVADRPEAEKPKRKTRAGKFVRKRSDQPTQQIVHAVAECPRCRCHLVGGWVKRHRETIEIPLPQVEITSWSSGSVHNAARSVSRASAPPTGLSASIAWVPV